MIKYFLTAIATSAFLLAVTPAEAQNCRILERKCLMKDSLGQQGEGNCRRFRELCGGGGDRCRRLERACLFKDERGEVGQGNCRRFREECGGR